MNSSSCRPDIRRADAEDIPDVVRMENMVFSIPWSDMSFKEALSGGYIFAVLRDKERGTLLGYAVLDTRVLGEAELLRIAVSPDSRGKGYASALMEYLLENMNEPENGAEHTQQKVTERVLLEVRESNTAAIALYKKFGFTVDGVRKGYYRCPSEDAVLMTRV